MKALWNHDTSRPLGNTKTDTLRFNTGDTTGLNYDIDLPNNTWGNDVREPRRYPTDMYKKYAEQL
ncbi:HK97 family phage prohead protease [Mediterraneibacter faecis]|nr:HK97 family phage prohead protease [Mediterraneibacter faecis]